MPIRLPFPARPARGAEPKPLPAASLHAQRVPPPAPPRPLMPVGDVARWRLRAGVGAGTVALLVSGVVGGLGARSFAAGSQDSSGPAPSLLPTTLTLPPISLPALPLGLPSVPPVQLPPVALPALPPLIGPQTAAATAPAGLGAYRGLAGWVDLYHYGVPGAPSPAAAVAQMAARRVHTLYIETARWNSGGDLDHPADLGAYLDAAHTHGMQVVGWYLPGFADIATDVRRSQAVLGFLSATGQRFDGFAADIEDRSATGTLSRFNNGITAYSQALRGAVAPGTVLGAIVPDAKNNERAPAHWAGFPWSQIGASYDVVVPMAYWSVNKNRATCLSNQMDVTSYINEVIDRTTAALGQSRPIAPMGGISNCDTQQEVAQYVSTLRARGAIGGGLYDFELLEARADAGTLWAALDGLNH